MAENKNPNISVITPTARQGAIEVTSKCLRRQTYTDFEWIVASPDQPESQSQEFTWLQDPPKKEGDFWTLCKAWNNAYAHAKGELIVNIQDLIWFEPDLLERLWFHYITNPKTLVTAVGNHYDQLDEKGKPINVVWTDPRKRSDQGSFYEISPSDMEMSVNSIPKQAILDCGGIDEEYDKGPGVQEKEMSMRLSVLGYKMYIDQSIEYRAIRHERLTEDWDDKYWSVTAPLLKRHVQEMLEVKRPLNVGNIDKYIK